MKFRLLFILTAFTIPSFGQKETYDIFTFTAPKGWKRTTNENVISFSITNSATQTWAQLGIVKSTVSTGTVDGDFKSEWQQLGVKPYGVSPTPISTERLEVSGWNMISGAGKFAFNGDSAAYMLSTFSDGVRCASITIMSNSMDYGADLDAFLSTVTLPPPSSPQKNVAPQQNTAKQNPVAPTTASGQPRNDGYAFNRTNFDDGWVSIIKEDWVEVTKGPVIVRLHYPNKAANIAGDPEPSVAHAWNTLVAPRFSNIESFRAFGSALDWQRAELGSAWLTNSQGKRVFVFIFQKVTDDWMEIECPDKETFVQYFGFDPQTLPPDASIDTWNKVLPMSGYNKFAVSEKDLRGTWSSDFSSSQQYYNTYSGTYAGYTSYQSNVTFVFGPNNTYSWKLIMVQSSNGFGKADQGESSGTFRFNNNWQVHFSKIDKKPSTYDVYFSAIKGARLLHMKISDYGGYTAYGKIKD